MERNTKENGIHKQIFATVEESLSGLTVLDTMDSLSRAKQTAAVESFTLRAIATMENGVMIRSMDMEYSKQRTEADMKANGKMISKTV